MASSFGPYVVVSRVAAGSTGTVFRARHGELGRDAAIKELSPALREVPGFVERMRSEAETLASLDDEHIVKVYDFVEEPDRVWIAEQWVDGVSLEQILTLQGSLTAEQSVGVIRGALIGLAHAHAKDMVHRDFAPTNILADEAGMSMLVDFGMAAPVGGVAVLGTPAYMSPEAARGEPVTKPSDVYSAAAVLFALLSGRPPFPGADAASVVKQHAEAMAPVLEGHGSQLQSLIARSMDKDAANRPADAAVLLAELEEAAESRFGAGWLGRASIASIAAATLASVTAAGLAAGGGAAVTAGVGAAQTVVVDAATLATGSSGGAAAGGGGVAATAVPRKILGLGVKQAIAAGVAAVVVVGAAAVGVNAYADHRAEVKAEKVAAAAAAKKAKAEAAAKAAEEAKVKAFADNAPSGQWNVLVTIVATTFADETAGGKDNVTWTLTPTCKEYLCSGSIASSSGSKFTYTWDGKAILVTRPPLTVSTRCFGESGGQVGESGPATYTNTYQPLVADPYPATGGPERFEGGYTQAGNFSKVPNCDPTASGDYKLVLTKKG